MGNDRTATGWATAGIRTSVTVTRPSLTIEDIDAYVHRGSATTTQAKSLESDLDDLLVRTKSIDTSLGNITGGALPIALDFARDRSRSSALTRARALIGAIPNRFDVIPNRFGDDTAILLAEQLAEFEVLSSDRVIDYSEAFARSRSLAIVLRDALLIERSLHYSALYTQMGIVIYGLVAFALVPVSGDGVKAEAPLGGFVERIAKFDAGRLHCRC